MRSPPTHGAVLDRLLDALARGQLLPLVPALRRRLPDSRARFRPPGPEDSVPVEALLRIPEVQRFLCGERRLVEKLSAMFDTSRIDAAGLPLHSALVRLSRFVPAIYTTNFDDLLEKAFAAAGRTFQVVAAAEDLHRWQHDRVGGRFVPRFPIYKLHGTLARPDTLVVGESDFHRRSDLAANPIDLRFCSDVMGRQLLLVGYGFNDPNMRWIWTKLRDLEVPPVGWFLELGASSDLERASMEMDRIVRVDLEARDPERPRELLELLGALCDRAERELRAPAAAALTPPSRRRTRSSRRDGSRSGSTRTRASSRRARTSGSRRRSRSS